MNTPVYVKSDNDEGRRDEPLYYLVTGSGVFVCRNAPSYSTDAPMDPEPEWDFDKKKWRSRNRLPLPQHEPYVELRYPLVPRRILFEAVGFFKAVYKIHNSECLVLLLWDREERRYWLDAPDQKVNRSSCDYEPPTDLLSTGRHMVVGDIHSHGSFGPTHSWTDKDDEAHADGLHVIVGDVDRHPVRVATYFAADGYHFRIAPSLGVFDDEKVAEWPKWPREWLDRVEYQTYAWKDNYGGGGRLADGRPHYRGDPWQLTYRITRRW